jgi:3-oxoacyl-[acyl-carrier-protein] synthase III
VPKAVTAALEKTGVSASDIDHFVMPCSFARLPQKLAKRLKISKKRSAQIWWL